MKTSNKILTGLFVLPFIIVFLISLALYAKIKSGNFISQKQQEIENSIIKNTTAFTDIDLSAFNNGHVNIKHSDSFSIKYDKWERENIEYEQQGNKLILKTKPGRDYNTATIFCPSFSNLNVNSLEVNVDDMRLSNAIINLGENASLQFEAQAQNLLIKAEKDASISFGSNAAIDTLNISLANGAALNKNNDGLIKHLGTVQLSDSAMLSVDGKTMRMFLEKSAATIK